MIQPGMAEQLSALVPKFQKILISGVTKKGFDLVPIAHGMMIAGMLEMLEAAGKEFTLELLADMVTAVEDDNLSGNSLQ